MIGLISIEEQVDRDFDRALLKASLRRWRDRLRRNPTHDRLLSFDEAKGALARWSHAYRGMRTVEVDKITGSVDRYRDFDESFLPLKVSLGDRWSRIDRAYHRGDELPAVSLYKIGETYFVRDGNHRVSVARYHRVEAIDAEVVELRGRLRPDAAQGTAPPHRRPTDGQTPPPRKKPAKAGSVTTKAKGWAASGAIMATMLVAAVALEETSTPRHEAYPASGFSQQQTGFGD